MKRRALLVLAAASLAWIAAEGGAFAHPNARWLDPDAERAERGAAVSEDSRGGPGDCRVATADDTSTLQTSASVTTRLVPILIADRR